MSTLSHRIRRLAHVAGAGPSYEEYVTRKRSEGGEPLSKEDWETKVFGPDSEESDSDESDSEPDTKKVLEDHGVDEGDLPKLRDLFTRAQGAVKKETGEEYEEDDKKHPAQALADAIEWFVTKVKSVLDFDEFVKDLPAGAKELAKTLTEKHKARKKEKKQEADESEAQGQKEDAEDAIQKTYTKYVEWAKGEGKEPLSKKEWESKVKGEGSED